MTWMTENLHRQSLKKLLFFTVLLQTERSTFYKNVLEIHTMNKDTFKREGGKEPGGLGWTRQWYCGRSDNRFGYGQNRLLCCMTPDTNGATDAHLRTQKYDRERIVTTDS